MFIGVVIVVSAVVVFALGLYLSERHDRRAEKRREQMQRDQDATSRRRLLALCDKAEQGNEPAMERLANYQGNFGIYLSYDETTRFCFVREKVRADLWYRRQQSEIALRLWRLLDATDRIAAIDTLELLNGVVRCHPLHCEERFQVDFGLSVDAITEQVGRLYQEQYDELLPQCENSSEVFLNLRALLDHVRDPDWKHMRPKLPYPDKWNYWVAQYFRTPALGDFAHLPESKDGDYRTRAAAALRLKDPVEAKILLAYCDDINRVRQELGDVLVAEMAKLTDAHDAARQLLEEKRLEQAS